ncbi:MAG: ribose-phosphate pyrophosphokinase [Deltaproteobacteria bacterium]|nr:ribose-phosphate pyrophosphokinase [Deltaproteobacteria bacterium]
MSKMKLITGNGNRELAEEISGYLNIPLTPTTVNSFSDGEINVRIEESVRGDDIYVIQSLSHPVNKNIVEMLIIIDALKRASSGSIVAVMPYYAYARQDRKVEPRVPITAKLIADLITVAGANKILCMDLHVGQIQGFFNIPVDHLYAFPVILDYIKSNMLDNVVIVSPDAGGVERARSYARKLNTSLAIIDKRRPEPNVSEVLHVIGEVKDKIAIIVDDMVDTGGTLINASEALKKAGAKRIYACCTHPILSGNAVKKIESSSIEKLIVTNTIKLSSERTSSKIEVLSVAPLIGEAIKRISNKESVSSLFL